MSGLDLRPLSLGEILDRTFTLYRGHFVLFLGIVGIPHLLLLAVSLTQILMSNTNPLTPNTFSVTSAITGLAMVVASIAAYLFSQGGAILAVSQIYLGRPVSIAEALGRVWDHFGFLLGVVILNGLAIMGATILLVIPGIYVGCRLLVCVPVALVEEKSPRDSLSRSWQLTSGFAGRAFMIALLYFCIAVAAGLLFSAPFTIGVFVNLKDPSVSRIWLVLNQIGSTIAEVIVSPILMIATSIFYYDLRVRKEAFDLQLLLDPSGPQPASPGSLPSIL